MTEDFSAEFDKLAKEARDSGGGAHQIQTACQIKAMKFQAQAMRDLVDCTDESIGEVTTKIDEFIETVKKQGTDTSEESGKLRRVTWLLAIGTFALAVFTAALAGFTWWMAASTQKLADEAQMNIEKEIKAQQLERESAQTERFQNKKKFAEIDAALKKLGVK